jgi:hypothetical protein
MPSTQPWYCHINEAENGVCLSSMSFGTWYKENKQMIRWIFRFPIFRHTHMEVSKKIEVQYLKHTAVKSSNFG